MPPDLEQKQTALFDLFDELGIAHETRSHAPVFTVTEAQVVRDAVPGAHTKNLFIKDKKSRYFLLVLEETAELDLKTVHEKIGAKGRVSFANAERLMEYLGVTPGSVTALAAMNDEHGAVDVVLDAALMEHDVINAHPLSNDRTTSLSRDDLVRFLRRTGHEPRVLKLTG